MLINNDNSSRFDDTKQLLAQHLPTLDGIRGLAILMVVVHNVASREVGLIDNLVVKIIHALSETGWIGVQLFFVLSGFLITGILLDGKNSPHHLRNFYIRRGLRIFPLYYAFLIFFFIILPLFNSSPEWSSNTQSHQVWYWLYLINWVQPFHRDIEFGHIWSLAIEEQFYLLWPLLVYHVRSKTLVYVCIFLVISAAIFRSMLLHFLPETGVNAAYTFTIARYDALAIGALVAIICRNEAWYYFFNKRSLSLIIFLLVTILITTAINHSFSPAKGIGAEFHQTFIALLFGLFIFISIPPNKEKSSLLYRALSNNILVKYGKYSYAIYLFHIPVKYFWFSRFSLPAENYHGLTKLWPIAYNVTAILLISTVLAIISWYILERPCLKLKRHFS